jgi:hypothetical protein
VGFFFDLDHANFVAYLTAPEGTRAPRAFPERLFAFFESLSRISPHDQQFLIASDWNWIEAIRRISERAARRIQPRLTRNVLGSPEVVGRLRKLRPYFQGYSIYALIVGANDPKAREFFRSAALASAEDGLVLMPHGGSEEVVNVIDPFPAVRSLAEIPLKPPAVVFWTALGGACALPLRDA